MDHELSWTVVELVGLHRLDEAEIVSVFREMRKPVRNPGARVAILPELGQGAHHVGGALDEGETLAFEKLLGARFAIELLQLWLVIKELVLWW